jgi:PadR family transcriptional regulator, regulatory protein PadR
MQSFDRSGSIERDQTNLLQGTLDLLTLKAIGEGEMHGLDVTRRVEQITRGTFQVRPGSLFSGPSPHGRGWVAEFLLA